VKYAPSAAILMLVATSTWSNAESLGPMFVTDSANNLLLVDVASGSVSQVGSTAGQLTDIAFASDGRLFGITSTYVYEIEPTTGWSTLLGPHGLGGPVNSRGLDALAFGHDGVLYAAGDDAIASIDTTTGEGTLLGNLSGFRSAGDIAVDAAGRLLLTTDSGMLVEVDPDGTGAVPVGDIPFSDVYAIARGNDGTIYGLRSTGDVLTIDGATGAGQVVTTLNPGFLIGRPFGGSFQPHPVPEPSAMLIAAGMALIATRRRRELR
jgi:outer membrane protein assembly factor BamB